MRPAVPFNLFAAQKMNNKCLLLHSEEDLYAKQWKLPTAMEIAINVTAIKTEKKINNIGCAVKRE